MSRALAAVLAVGLLAGCSGEHPKRQPAPYVAGGSYDAEEYGGPTQLVVNREIDAEKRDLECTRKTTDKKTKRSECVAWKPVVVDDLDWLLHLADGTVVDVNGPTFASHPEGSVYP